MPLVRITGWQRGLRPNLPPAPLATLLVKEIGMNECAQREIKLALARAKAG